MDDLEDDSLDPPDIPTRDLNRQVRKLAAAVLVQAVIDSKLQDLRQRQDAEEFLNPQSVLARYHFRRMAELANVSPAWLSECIARCANTPLPEIRQCPGCKAMMAVSALAPRYDGDPGRYCSRCREMTPICPGKRRFGKRG
jgi:hypothetical protein